MNFYKEPICFVGMHLSAHTHNLDKRIEQLKTILRKPYFNINGNKLQMKDIEFYILDIYLLAIY